eukprot:GHRR01007160.1.p1 GENE.GHRR01007160.1~~GHRR01007160.1.p1  ORF type:complete len:411 (+),score=147.40 GHRR01007160.1:87-1319(+)
MRVLGPGLHMQEPNKQLRWHPATRELVGGVLAGAMNVTSGFPFDTMKVRLQATNGVYTGMTDCFWHIWNTEGVRGFFRGLSSPLIGGAAETGVNYLVYSRVLDMFRPQQQSVQQQLQQQCQQQWQPDQQKLPEIAHRMHNQQIALYLQQQQQQVLTKQPQQQQHGHSSSLPPLHAIPVAGAVAGAALSFILAPTELVKCRMQMAQYNGPLRCLTHLLQTEGLRGLSRGFVPTLCREVPGNALFFTVYEGLRRSWPGRPSIAHGSSNTSGIGNSNRSTSSLGAVWQVVLDAGGAIVCGGLAGTVMWATVLPLDVAKTRIQTSQPGSSWDTGVLRQLAMLWQEGRFSSLWAGLAPTLVRAFPANACQWLAWELAMQQLLPPAHEPTEEGQQANVHNTGSAGTEQGVLVQGTL